MFNLSKQKRLAVPHWRRFSRKNYSVFCSIGRVVAIGVLTVASLGSAQPVKAVVRQSESTALSADDDDDDGGGASVNLGEVEVTASMTSLSAGRPSRIVAVINRADISRSAAVQCVGDVLKLVPRVDVRQRGAFGVQSDISIDGGTADQITVLINGVNISSSQTGHLSFDWPVDIADIERIEVLEGASSRVAGGSSLLGAVNIVTRPRESSEASVSLDGGSYGSLGASARVNIASGPVSQFISGGYMRSDGGTQNSDFKRSRMFYQGRLTRQPFDIDWQAGWSDLDHGANTFYSAAYPNQHDHTKRFVVSVGGRSRGRFRVEPLFYFNRLSDHFELIKGSPIGENHHRTDVLGGRLNASTDWCAGTTTIGAEVRREAIASNILGLPVDSTQWILTSDGAWMDHKFDRTNTNVYLDHSLRLGRFNASAGVVAASNSGIDGKMRFYPGVDLSYLPGDHGWRIFASYSSSFRMPTFTDLFYVSPTHTGNPNLKAEQMRSIQLGSSLSRSAFNCGATAFYHHGSNMLDWVMFSPDDLYHSAAFDLDNMGLELIADIRFQQLFGSKQPLRSLHLGYNYIHQHRLDNVQIYKSSYALEYLRHKFIAQLSHTLGVDGLTASWSLRWQQRRGSYLVYRDGQSTGEQHPYSPYATLSLKINYNLPYWSFSIEGNNLTNHRYYDLGNIPQPGLWLMAGLTYRTQLSIK